MGYLQRHITGFGFLVLFALVLYGPVTPRADAQTGVVPKRLGQITCQASAVPPIVAAESITAVVADILLTCTNIELSSSQFTQYIQTNMSVSLTVFVTNQIDFGAGANVTTAVMVINENLTNAPTAVSIFGGPDARFTVPHAGTLIGTNRVEWNQVNFPVPGAPNKPGAPPSECTSFSPHDPTGCFPETTTVRFAGLRGNATQLGVPDPATFPPAQIQAFVSLTGPSTIPTNNNVLNVAVPIIGLIPGFRPPSEPCTTTTHVIHMELQEGFATGFRVGNQARSDGVVIAPAGFPVPGSDNGGGEGSTRFLLRMFNIPVGLTVSVPMEVNNGTPEADGDELLLRYVAGADDHGAGGTVSMTGGVQELAVADGFASAVYEVFDADPFDSADIEVPISLTWAPSANPAVVDGQIAMSVTLAPISSVFLASSSQPATRFLDVGDNSYTTDSTVFACPQGNGCQFSLAPERLVAGPAGGSYPIAVSASNEQCVWQPSTDDIWLLSSVGGMPQPITAGSATVDVLVEPNTNDFTRSANLYIPSRPAVPVKQNFTYQEFFDVLPDNFAFDGANRLRQRGITDGCDSNPLRYCPEDQITRGQMAVFIVRAIFGTDDFPFSEAPEFDDVPPGHLFFKWIQKMKELGITGGCAELQYCPGAPTTRGQMAVFLIRMRYGADFAFGFPANPQFFDDVPATHPFFAWIQKLRREGITTGCATRAYCAEDPVTRGQMAIFISRAGFNELQFAGYPRLLSAGPNQALPGQTVIVAVAGRDAFFSSSGSPTIVAAMDGVSVGPIVVLNQNALFVELTVVADATPGPRSIVAMTGGLEAVLPNGFTVLPEAP